MKTERRGYTAGYMKKIIISVIILIVLAMCLSACMSEPAKEAVAIVTPDGGTSVETVQTVDVSGVAKLSVAPDMVTINVGTQAEEADMEKAYSKNAELINTVIESLKAKGIDEADIQTSNYEMYETYADNGKINGYHVGCMIEVEVHEIDKASSILNAAIDAGATRSYGMYFGISDPDAYYEELAEKAVKNARAKADAIAKAIDREIDGAIYVSDGSASYEPIYRNSNEQMVKEAVADTETSMDIMQGELELSSTLYIKFTLK